MKLLFLAHRIPYPANKGDKIRSYHQLQGFVERGHEVHLLAFADDVGDLTYQEDLSRFCASVRIVRLNRHLSKMRALTRLLINQPLSLGYYASPKMRRLIHRSIIEHDFDAVFVYSSTMAQYVPEDLLSRTVVDLVDVDSEKWRDYAGRAEGMKSAIYGIEWKRLRKYEHEIVSRFAYTILSTNREAALLDGLDEFTRRARLRMITNGVDSNYFQPKSSMDYPSRPRLVFVGAMDYFANIDGACWFVEEVLPLIRQRRPGVEFFIVGSSPAGRVRGLGKHEGVTVTGSVDDVRPFLHSADVCVIPLRVARGVQNKVLEAMAAGKAIVATREAIAGLRIEDGRQLLVAQTPREFADATLKIIGDRDLRETLSSKARSFVELEHDWEPLLQKLVELVESVAVRRSTKANTVSRVRAHNSPK